jgi:transposase
MTRRATSAALRTQAEAMRARGVSVPEIARALEVSRWTVYDWFRPSKYARVKTAREQRKKKPAAKSGVVAPRAYFYGAKWGAGWV